MANNPKKVKDPTEVALSAIQEALNISDVPLDTNRSSVHSDAAPAEQLRRLAAEVGDHVAVADRGRKALSGHRYRGERHAAWRGAADQEQFSYRAFHRGVDVHIPTL